MIATPDSTISDIERALSLGWITKKSAANDLIQKLKAAIKIEKKIELLEEKLPGKPKVIKKIERLEKKLDKVLGKQFLKELEAYYKKSRITVEGYNLLKEDAEWMLGDR